MQRDWDDPRCIHDEIWFTNNEERDGERMNTANIANRAAFVRSCAFPPCIREILPL